MGIHVSLHVGERDEYRELVAWHSFSWKPCCDVHLHDLLPVRKVRSFLESGRDAKNFDLALAPNGRGSFPFHSWMTW